MTEETRNFYKENCYPRWAIAKFNRTQDYTGQFPRVSAQEVATTPEFSAITPGSIDILYRFFADPVYPSRRGTMALAFRFDEKVDDYELLYCDPSLQEAWQQMMDQEQNEW